MKFFAKKNYAGKDVKKDFTVSTNDKDNQTFKLTLTGHVSKLVTLSPDRVLLSGAAGDPIARTVTITPGVKHPFNIVDVRTLQGAHIDVKVEKTKISGNPAYKLIVTNKMEKEGRYFDRIFVKTDMENEKEFSIPVTGHIRAVQ